MKNNIKRLCVFVLILCMVSGSVCVSVSSYGGSDGPVDYEADQRYVTDVLSDYVDINELRAYLCAAFAECPDGKIDMSQYNIPLTVLEELKAFIWREMPECFHVKTLTIYKSNGYLTGLGANYRYATTKEQYAEMMSACEERAAVMLDGVKDNDDLSDAEKALILHDRLAVHCTYCYNSSVQERYTMYGALVLGTAVCDGYTRAYSYLLRLAGIESINCASDELVHAWNLVLIDGHYYHVDVTWDDPSIARNSVSYEGAVKHTYFLLSNDAVKADKHNADDFFMPADANDTKYDNYFWRCSNTEFQLVNGQIYYFDNENATLMRLNGDRKSGTALYTVPDRWWSPDRTFYWTGNYSKLSSDNYSLFFSSSDTVYIFDPETGEATEIFKPELKDGSLIYGFTYKDGYLICDTNEQPFEKYEKLEKVKQLYVPQSITAELSSEVELKSSQTVHAEITSATGISGYYFGTKSKYNESDIVKTNQSSIAFTVTEPGTYYFVAFDGSGKCSETVSLTFCLINLHANGATLESDTILTEKNNVFDLPIPKMDGFRFCGWTDDQNSQTGVVLYEINDPPLTSDFYALWKESTDVAMTVKTVSGAEVTVTAFDADGNVIGILTSEDGALTFGITDDIAFFEIAAPGHIGKIYRIDSLSVDGFDDKLELVGDTNGDDELNNKDVTVLFRAVSGKTVVYNDAADVNADGEENNKDVALLFRFLSDPKTKLIVHSVRMYA